MFKTKNKKKLTKKQLAARKQIQIELIVFTLMLAVISYLSMWVGYMYFDNEDDYCRSCAPYPEDLIQPVIYPPDVVDLNSETVSASYEEVIEQVGAEVGLVDWEIERFKKIAYCESRGKADAQNANSSAAGIFQIIRGTWNENSELDFDQHKYDPLTNTRVAMNIYERYGYSPWECNKLV